MPNPTRIANSKRLKLAKAATDSSQKSLVGFLQPAPNDTTLIFFYNELGCGLNLNIRYLTYVVEPRCSLAVR